jgi:hypothetical protein
MEVLWVSFKILDNIARFEERKNVEGVYTDGFNKAGIYVFLSVFHWDSNRW